MIILDGGLFKINAILDIACSIEIVTSHPSGVKKNQWDWKHTTVDFSSDCRSDEYFIFRLVPRVGDDVWPDFS